MEDCEMNYVTFDEKGQVLCKKTEWFEGSIAITDELLNERLLAIREEARLIRFQLESDPLFFKWQRGECSKETWLSSVAKIESELP